MFKILDESCKPTKGSRHSAAIDLYAREDTTIAAGKSAIVPLGVCLDPDKFPIYIQNNLDSLYIQLEPRSSLRAKGIISGTGIIDIDYKDEIKIILHNPITDINKEIDFNKDDDYIELDYMGASNDRKYKASSAFIIKKGEKIAQIILCEHKSYLFNVKTYNKRTGGIGSTGR
jgi:dUTPase